MHAANAMPLAPTAPPEGASPSLREAVGFGGVDYRFDSGVPTGFPSPSQLPWLQPVDVAPSFVRVRVRLDWVVPGSLNSPRRGKGPPPVVAAWREPGREASVRADGLRLCLRRVSEGWLLEGEADDDVRGAERALSSVASLLAEAHGGLSMHAASVSWRGRGVLFLGPSGSGKSTASRHLHGAKWLGHDRAVVWPRPAGGWLVWGLPWGTPTSPAHPAPQRWAPLGALVRVGRGERTTLRLLSGADALLVVRAAAWRGFEGARAEVERLDAAWKLANGVAVARLAHRLGEPFDGLLADALIERGEAP